MGYSIYLKSALKRLKRLNMKPGMVAQWDCLVSKTKQNWQTHQTSKNVSLWYTVSAYGHNIILKIIRDPSNGKPTVWVPGTQCVRLRYSIFSTEPSCQLSAPVLKQMCHLFSFLPALCSFIKHLVLSASASAQQYGLYFPSFVVIYFHNCKCTVSF